MTKNENRHPQPLFVPCTIRCGWSGSLRGPCMALTIAVEEQEGFAERVYGLFSFTKETRGAPTLRLDIWWPTASKREHT